MARLPRVYYSAPDGSDRSISSLRSLADARKQAPVDNQIERRNLLRPSDPPLPVPAISQLEVRPSVKKRGSRRGTRSVRFGRPRVGATPEALEELYRARFRAFLRVAATISGERHAADAVHNAFVRALRHRASFRESGSLEAWVWRTVVNAARDMRGADRNELGLDHYEPLGNGHPSTRDERVRGVIVALPPQQRLAVFLRYYADLDYATIAGILDLSPGTVAATLHKAHAAIRRRLQEEGATCRTS